MIEKGDTETEWYHSEQMQTITLLNSTPTSAVSKAEITWLMWITICLLTCPLLQTALQTREKIFDGCFTQDVLTSSHL